MDDEGAIVVEVAAVQQAVYDRTYCSTKSCHETKKMKAKLATIMPPRPQYTQLPEGVKRELKLTSGKLVLSRARTTPPDAGRCMRPRGHPPSRVLCAPEGHRRCYPRPVQAARVSSDEARSSPHAGK